MFNAIFDWCGFSGAVAPSSNPKKKAGRPKGAINKTYKLDLYKEDIRHYLSLKMSLTDIGTLTQSHPMTVAAYIKRNSDLKALREGND